MKPKPQNTKVKITNEITNKIQKLRAKDETKNKNIKNTKTTNKHKKDKQTQKHKKDKQTQKTQK